MGLRNTDSPAQLHTAAPSHGLVDIPRCVADTRDPLAAFPFPFSSPMQPDRPSSHRAASNHPPCTAAGSPMQPDSPLSTAAAREESGKEGRGRGGPVPGTKTGAPSRSRSCRGAKAASPEEGCTPSAPGPRRRSEDEATAASPNRSRTRTSPSSTLLSLLPLHQRGRLHVGKRSTSRNQEDDSVDPEYLPEENVDEQGMADWTEIPVEEKHLYGLVNVLKEVLLHLGV
ncbi:hypothetical protein U9M48_036497 [Paspalum notatum var. saurae]|uniref:Uncharacterized protein n=1 Tax=Paspalum notatum var. saurae TaxID=547442 RepID=A0AAQ3UHB4_PASNO